MAFFSSAVVFMAKFSPAAMGYLGSSARGSIEKVSREKPVKK
jgi:hypothetical protein